jgi:hypothetical protein
VNNNICTHNVDLCRTLDLYSTDVYHLQSILGLAKKFDGALAPCHELIASALQNGGAVAYIHLECPCLSHIPEDSEEAQDGGMLDCRFSAVDSRTALDVVRSCHDGSHATLNESSRAWLASRGVPDIDHDSMNLIISELVRGVVPFFACSNSSRQRQ